MKQQCDICNRTIEPHLVEQKKGLCFSCLTEGVSLSGAVPTFNIKNKPVRAPCAICDFESSGPNLFPSPWGFICNNCRSLCETQTGVTWDDLKIVAQKEWLVKAGTRIMGPYAAQEVEEQIRQNQIVAHDEISKPAGRWRLLRDEDQFRLVINEMRNYLSSGVSRLSEITQSGTLTPTASLSGTTPVSDYIDDEYLSGNRPPPPDSANTRDLLKSYAAKEDVRVMAEIQKHSNKRIWAALGVLIIVGVVTAIKLSQPQEGTVASKTSSFQEAMSLGLRAKKTGDYQKALGYFIEARNIKPNDAELLLNLAPLTLIYEHRTTESQRMFAEMLEMEPGSNYQRAGFLGLGLVAIEILDYQGAKENFIKALKIDPDHMPTLANLGMTSFFTNDLVAAEVHLLKALEKGSADRSTPDGSVTLALAETYLAQNDETKVSKKLSAAHQLLESYLGLNKDFEQEILLEEARVLTALQKPTEAAKKIDEFLDVDPEQSDLHTKDFFVYGGFASWVRMADTLKRVASELPPSPRLTAALGLTVFRSRERLDGKQTVEQALTQSPQDPLLMALTGWVEMKVGHPEVGSVNIRQSALMTDKIKLPHILQARVCFNEKDYDCAKQQWTIVLNLDPRSVAAFHGLAQVEWAHRNTDGANKWILQGQATDASYIPNLVLAQEIQKANGGK